MSVNPTEIIGNVQSQTQEYLRIFEMFESFFKKMTCHPQLSPKDLKHFREIETTFDLLKQNLITLDQELSHYFSYDLVDQKELIEVSSEILSKAAIFILSIPEQLSKTDISSTMDFEFPNVQELISNADKTT